MSDVATPNTNSLGSLADSVNALSTIVTSLNENKTWWDTIDYGAYAVAVYFTTPWEIEGLSNGFTYPEPWRKTVVSIGAFLTSIGLFFIPTLWGVIHRSIHECCGSTFGAKNRFWYQQAQYERANNSYLAAKSFFYG